MVLGYGEVGQLVMKYLLSHKIQTVYLVVRNPKIKDEIQDERVKVITFEEKNKYINSIECIVSCTSAPHPVVKTEDISESGSRLVYMIYQFREMWKKRWRYYLGLKFIILIQ